MAHKGRVFIEAVDEEMDAAFTEGPASGRMYPSRRTGKQPKLAHPKAFGGSSEKGPMHQASAAGESPHEDTGDLRTSKTVDLSGLHGINPTASVGWEGEDALVPATLEHGTADGTRAPRPFIDRSVKKGIAKVDLLPSIGQ